MVKFVATGIGSFPNRITTVIPIKYPLTSTNLDIRIAIDDCLVTATIDGADRTDGKQGIAATRNFIYFV